MDFLIYLLEASIALVVLYLPYVLLKNNTFFGINRCYMLLIMALSIVVPMLNLSIQPVNDAGIAHIMLDPVNIVANNYIATINTDTSIFQIIFYIYILGTLINFTLFTIRFGQIVHLIRRHQVVTQFGYKTVTVRDDIAPSSFFNYIFLPGGENEEEIIAHEQEHIKRKHSIDIIIHELIFIIFWFHPLKRVYRNSIRNIHEFQADREILLKGVGVIRYQQLLVEKTFGYNINQLAISFNYSPLKKRLIMMTKNKSKGYKKWQYVFAIASVLLVFTCFGFTSSPINVAGISGNNQKPEAQKEDKKQIKEADKGEVFVIVDEMPAFKHLEYDDFRKYVADHLVYPQEAIKNKIQGKVYIQFEVSADGNVQNVEIARSVDPTLDKEALRVISSSPKWIPGKLDGKNVSVRFTYPVNFVLQ